MEQMQLHAERLSLLIISTENKNKPREEPTAAQQFRHGYRENARNNLGVSSPVLRSISTQPFKEG